jgi:hypothetical protein
MEPEWKSQRQIEAEVAAYRAKRFEDYMVKVDAGELVLALACAALREEIQYQEVLNGKQTTS